MTPFSRGICPGPLFPNVLVRAGGQPGEALKPGVLTPGLVALIPNELDSVGTWHAMSDDHVCIRSFDKNHSRQGSLAEKFPSLRRSDPGHINTKPLPDIGSGFIYDF